MSQAEKAKSFAELHRPGTPLLLYNIWDAGGAKALAEAGAPAVATGSWSLAAAQGYSDGQAIPLDLVLQIVARIAATVEVPLTVDFEGGSIIGCERGGIITKSSSTRVVRSLLDRNRFVGIQVIGHIINIDFN